MRATPPPSSSVGRHGRTANVLGSGSAIMSDSSIALKPVIEDPSKPMPPSNASSSSSALIENDFSWPRMSVNQRRMKRMPRSWTSALTSSWVCGRSSFGTGRETSQHACGARWTGGPGSVQPAVGPALELAERRIELAAPLGQLVLDPHRRGGRDVALDDPGRLELLHALGQQPVRESGDGMADLAEAQRAAALEQHVEDRPG